MCLDVFVNSPCPADSRKKTTSWGEKNKNKQKKREREHNSWVFDTSGMNIIRSCTILDNLCRIMGSRFFFLLLFFKKTGGGKAFLN